MHRSPLGIAQSHMSSLAAGIQTAGGASRAANDGTLVARDYGRRDFYLRRLLALSDVFCLGAALALALALDGGGLGGPFWERLGLGLITLPAWVVLFKMYGLYDRDTKRLSHSTLEDLPSLFHGLLLGCLLLWCWFAVVARTALTAASTWWS